MSFKIFKNFKIFLSCTIVSKVYKTIFTLSEYFNQSLFGSIPPPTCSRNTCNDFYYHEHNKGIDNYFSF